jgi:hypothetical protein
VSTAVKLKKSPPYSFILDELDGIVTSIKPMFGAYGIYRDHQILMILRKKEKFDNDTGMWLGVVPGAHDSLKKEIPELRDLEMFGTGPTGWQVLGEDLENFEEVALQICELIKKKDPRIGRTPKARIKSAKNSKMKIKPRKKAKPLENSKPAKKAAATKKQTKSRKKQL